MNSSLTRTEVYAIVDGERTHQDVKWPQDPPLPPSDEIRLIRVILSTADREWYTTPDNLVEGTNVNPADLEALRKIAAVAVRAMETWGAIPRQSD
jgi:hypothetical protein